MRTVIVILIAFAAFAILYMKIVEANQSEQFERERFEAAINAERAEFDLQMDYDKRDSAQLENERALIPDLLVILKFDTSKLEKSIVDMEDSNFMGPIIRPYNEKWYSHFKSIYHPRFYKKSTYKHL